MITNIVGEYNTTMMIDYFGVGADLVINWISILEGKIGEDTINDDGLSIFCVIGCFLRWHLMTQLLFGTWGHNGIKFHHLNFFCNTIFRISIISKV